MPKPINETIGSCPCISKTCTQVADIRKVKNQGALYLNCNSCGILRLRSKSFQNYILDNGQFNSPIKSEALKPSPGFEPFIPEPEDQEPGNQEPGDQVKKEVKNNNFQNDGSENFDFQTQPKKEKRSAWNDWDL